MLLGVAILLVLAIPVLNLQLGQQNNGQLPKSTTQRQAYDLLTKGFGPGINGPLLIAVDFDGSPAHPDNKQLNQVEQQQKQATAAGGRPGHAAAGGRGRAPRRGAVRGRAAGEVTAADQAGEAGRPAGGLPEDLGERPAAGQAREQDLQDEGRQGRLAGDGRQVRQRGGVHGDRRPRRRPPTPPRTWSARCARRDPGARSREPPSRPTSAGRPPATSTSPTGSASGCRS